MRTNADDFVLLFNNYFVLLLLLTDLISITGLSVAYLSGRHSSDGQQFGMYTQDDVDALRAIAEEPGIVDFFLTYPCSTMNGSCS